jgi:hypothetical protein
MGTGTSIQDKKTIGDSFSCLALMSSMCPLSFEKPDEQESRKQGTREGVHGTWQNRSGGDGGSESHWVNRQRPPAAHTRAAAN